MCDCKCAKVEKKQERIFDILNRTTGDYIYDVPESQLNNVIQDLWMQGCSLQELKITQEIFMKQVWMINE